MFPKPNLFISGCIEHEHCRYDGTMIGDEHIRRLKPYVNEFRVCPELAIGFSSPRESLRLIEKDDRLQFVSSKTGEEFTDEMRTFSEKYLSKLPEMDGFVLKAKSPSCGFGDVKVYYDIGKAHTKRSKQSGMFGGAVIDRFNVPVETERRISNFSIREMFYIAIFTLASFRELESDFKYKKLVDFHSKNKYLFMTYKQAAVKKLGNIVANHNHLPNEEVIKQYKEILIELLKGSSTTPKRVNTLTHIYGYFKDRISTEEKEFYFSLLDEYLNKQIPYRTVMNLLHSWSIRFQEEYLLNQTIFVPYPKKLVAVTDSGKA